MNGNRDPKTGRLVGTPVGEKFPAIIKREKELSVLCGRTVLFEKDYEELRLSGKMGVNAFCRRWNSTRGNILYGSNNRKSWVEQLNLRKHQYSYSESISVNETSDTCDICNASNIIANFYYWIAKEDGGPKILENGFNVCSNCSHRLDCIDIANATEDDNKFYVRCKKNILAYIDLKHNNDVEIKSLWKNRVENRSMK